MVDDEPDQGGMPGDLYSLGVDLGMTHTAAAVWQHGSAAPVPLAGRGHSVPSVLFLREDGDFLVGEPAVRRGMVETDRIARDVKRRFGDGMPLRLGDREVSAPELTTRLLRWVVDRVTEHQGGPPTHVTLTHPATWRGHRLDMLQSAAGDAGLGPVGLLSEPVAAAAYYASVERLETGDLLAVYDLGGGTFDATVVARTVGGFTIRGRPVGDDHLGGIDFDQSVMDHVAAAIGPAWDDVDLTDPAAFPGLAQVREHGTAAKETLSVDVEATVPVILPGLARQVRITRSELEDALRAPLLHTIDLLNLAIDSAGIVPGDLRAVLLIGGSSRIPLVSQLIASEIAVPVALDAHPKYATCLGAAVVASAHLAVGAGVTERIDTAASTQPTTPPTTPQFDEAPLQLLAQPAPVSNPTAELPSDPPSDLTTDQLPEPHPEPDCDPPDATVPTTDPSTAEQPAVARGRVRRIEGSAIALLLLGISALVLLLGVAVAVVHDSESGPTSSAPAADRAAPPSVETMPRIVQKVAPGGTPTGVAVTPDGSRIYVAVDSIPSVSVLNAATGAVIGNVPLPGYHYLSALTVAPDGRSVWVTGGSRGITLIDTATNAVSGTVTDCCLGGDVTFGSDNTRAFVTHPQFPTVSVVDVAAHKVISSLPVEKIFDFSGSNGVALSVDSRQAYALVSDGPVDVVDFVTNRLIKSISNVYGSGIAMAPDGRHAYTNTRYRRLAVIDTATNTVSATVDIGGGTVAGGPDSLAVSGDGTRLYIATGYQLVVIDTGTNTVLSATMTGDGPVAVAVAPDGRRAYVANYTSGDIAVVDLGGGR